MEIQIITDNKWNYAEMDLNAALIPECEVIEVFIALRESIIPFF